MKFVGTGYLQAGNLEKRHENYVEIADRKELVYMSAEKRAPVGKQRISRRQMFKKIVTLGAGEPVDPKQDQTGIGGTVKYHWGAVVGATIVAAEKSAVSDNSGKYQLLGLTPGDYSVTVKVNFPGYETIPQNVRVAAGERSVVDFYLDFERTLVHGHVYDKDGIPIAGAALSVVRSGNDEETAVTDEKGYFKFENARPGYQFIRVNAQAYMGETRDFDAKKDEETKFEFHLVQADCKVSGIVLGDNDRPIGAEIALSSGTGIMLQKIQSNAETGSYEFSVVPGVYGLLLTAPEYQALGWRGQISGDQKLDFKLELGIGLRSSSSSPIRPYTPEDIRWP